MEFIELPEDDPEIGINHIKKISIRVEANTTPNTPPGDPIAHTLKFVNTYYDDEDGGGQTVNNPDDIDDIINQFVAEGVPLVSRFSGQLDFPLKYKCYVVIRLEGDFWEFIKDNPITTKKPHANARYYNLRVHEHGGRLSAVSFCARAPLKQPIGGGPGVKHGINLHIDFVERDPVTNQVTRRLPVIIDPDVENRGG